MNVQTCEIQEKVLNCSMTFIPFTLGCVYTYILGGSVLPRPSNPDPKSNFLYPISYQTAEIDTLYAEFVKWRPRG